MNTHSTQRDHYAAPYRVPPPTDPKTLDNSPPAPAVTRDLDRGICRNFVWGICRMGSQCQYRHQLEYESMKEILKFCRDYQNKNGCTRADCTYLHTSREEQNLFLATGQIPKVLVSRYIYTSSFQSNQDGMSAPPHPHHKYRQPWEAFQNATMMQQSMKTSVQIPKQELTFKQIQTKISRFKKLTKMQQNMQTSIQGSQQGLTCKPKQNPGAVFQYSTMLQQNMKVPVQRPMQEPTPRPIQKEKAGFKKSKMMQNMQISKQGPKQGGTSRLTQGPVLGPTQGHNPGPMTGPLQSSTPMAISMPYFSMTKPLPPPPVPPPILSMPSTRMAAIVRSSPQPTHQSTLYHHAMSQPILLPKFDPSRPPPPIPQAVCGALKRKAEYQAGPSKVRKVEPTNGSPCEVCVRLITRSKQVCRHMSHLEQEIERARSDLENKMEIYKKKKELLLSILGTGLYPRVEEFIENGSVTPFPVRSETRLTNYTGGSVNASFNSNIIQQMLSRLVQCINTRGLTDPMPFAESDVGFLPAATRPCPTDGSADILMLIDLIRKASGPSEAELSVAGSSSSGNGFSRNWDELPSAPCHLPPASANPASTAQPHCSHTTHTGNPPYPGAALTQPLRPPMQQPQNNPYLLEGSHPNQQYCPPYQ